MTRIVHIDWIDSCSIGSTTWVDRDDVDGVELSPIETVGFVIKETAAYISVVGSFGGACVSGHICIPKCAIKRIRPLAITPPEDKVTRAQARDAVSKVRGKRSK